MGAVWLGRDEVLGRPVAIKSVGLVPGDTSPDLVRAEREAKIAASLNHPHIVGVYDLVTEAGQLWMVMEYVEGSSLSELVRSRGPLGPDEAAPIIAQASSALAAAHANGIIHRDVKPGNILVRQDGHVKLTDFGIARAQADAALTQTGLVSGSPAYLAPEVASGQQATAASDVWSLGATLFHTLEGRPPYDASGNVLGALYKIVNEDPPRIDAGRLAPLLDATMTRLPEQRWTMADIGRFLATDGSERPPRQPNPTPTPTPTKPETVPVIPPLGLGSDDDGSFTGSGAGAGASSGAPAPNSTGHTRRDDRRRGSVLAAGIAVLVAMLVVAIVVLVLQDDPQRDTALDPGSVTSTTSATPTPTATPTATPAATPSPTPQTPVPTRKALMDFIDSYLSLASGEPAQGFELLTPTYQGQSTSYDDFWGSVSNPRLLDFSADPAALTVSYTYSYRLQGQGERVESVQLQLVATDDGYLIAGTL